jgi:hypothetical protein
MRIRFLLLPVLLGVLVLCNGCVLLLAGGAAAAGAGAVVYIDGELKDSEAASLDRTRVATLAAFKDMRFGVVGDESTAFKQTISVRTGSDKKIQVTLEKESSTVTTIHIRVGVFGDETLSRQLLDRIKSHL